MKNLDLEAIEARCEALDERVDKIAQTLEDIVTERDMAWMDVERLRRELHDEQVRRDEWEKMYNQAVAGTDGSARRERLAKER